MRPEPSDSVLATAFAHATALTADAALALGDAAVHAAREESVRWLLASLAVPLIQRAQQRAQKLPRWARAGGCFVLFIGAWRCVGIRARFSPLREPTEALLPAKALQTAGGSDALTRFRALLARKPVRQLVVGVLLIAALDLSNLGAAIDRADLVAGPLLCAGRAIARVAGPVARALWRAVRATARALVAFRASSATLHNVC
jgi:hypothetical protein